MSKNKIEIIPGEKYGMLTIIQEIEVDNLKNKRRHFLCKCDCGKETVVAINNLRNGHTKSCGCYKHERIVESNITHGDFGTRLYGIWNGMKQRCDNPNVESYKYYGARGITYCTEWKEYENFKIWAMSHGYSDDLTIDRIYVDSNYEPSNCRWETIKKQQNNRSNNKIIEFNGQSKTLSEWSEIIGIKIGTIQTRFKNGWSVEKTFTTTVKK